MRNTKALYHFKSVTGVFHGDPMLRQITESVRISRERPDRLMNNKTEWNYARVPHAVFLN